MQSDLSQLASDPAFRERAAALTASASRVQASPLDETFEPMRRFTAVRRREASIALLAEAKPARADEWKSNPEALADAAKGFSEALSRLSGQVAALRPLISPELDEVMRLAADSGHPLRALLRESALSLGFSSEEAGWLFAELDAIGFRPVKLVCAGGSDDLEALLSCISAGENGLLQAGFPRFTGDPDVDERLANIVIRLRDQGVTASLFLVLTIVVAAYAVAAHAAH
jgi:hypothetical protein